MVIMMLLILTGNIILLVICLYYLNNYWNKKDKKYFIDNYYIVFMEGKQRGRDNENGLKSKIERSKISKISKEICKWPKTYGALHTHHDPLIKQMFNYVNNTQISLCSVYQLGLYIGQHERQQEKIRNCVVTSPIYQISWWHDL